MEMKFNYSKAELFTSDVTLDFAKIIERIIEDAFLKCLNEYLSKPYITSIQKTSSVATNSLREFKMEFSPNWSEFTEDGIDALIRDTSRLTSQFRNYSNYTIDQELKNIEIQVLQIRHEIAEEDLQISKDKDNTKIICDTTIEDDGENVAVKIKTDVCGCRKKIPKLITKALGFLVATSLGFACNESLTDIYNNNKFHVLSLLTDSPQMSTVVDDYISVFEEEDSHSEKLGRLLYGDCVEIIDSSKYWYKVKYLNPMNEYTEGYIRKSALDYFIQ